MQPCPCHALKHRSPALSYKAKTQPIHGPMVAHADISFVGSGRSAAREGTIGIWAAEGPQAHAKRMSRVLRCIRRDTVLFGAVLAFGGGLENPRGA